MNDSLAELKKSTETEIAKKEASIKSLSEQIEQLKIQQQNEVSQKLSDKDSEIKKLNEQIEGLKSVKDKELSDKLNEVTSNLNASIKEAEKKHNAELGAKITEKDAQIKSLTEQLNELRNSKSDDSEKDKQIEKLQKELKEENQKLAVK